MGDNNSVFLTLSDGTEIFYRYSQIDDKKKNLVIINGFLQDLESWAPIAKMLAQNYNLLLYDLRGQGKTKISSENLTLDLHINDLFELISQLNLEKVNLVGLDLGALIILLFANYYPELIEKAILLGPLFGDRCQMILNDWKNIGELLGDFALINGVLPWLFSHTYIQENQDELFEILDYLAENINLVQILKQLESLLELPDIKGLLKNLNIPYLIMCGSEDSLCSVSGLTDTLKIPENKLKIIPNCGHWICYEDPTSLYDAIVEFIEK